MDHNMDEASVTKLTMPQNEGKVVEEPANAGLSAGSRNSGNTNSNIDGSALQNLNVRSDHKKIHGLGVDLVT